MNDHLRRVVSPAMLCVLASCGANPFASAPSDLGRVDTAERLRSIAHADFDAYRAPARPTPSPEEAARSRLENVPEVTLSIEDCRASALTNNLDLKVALVDPAIAAERVSQEDARFESTFTLRGSWRDLDQPTVSSLTSNQLEQQALIPGVRVPMRTGGTASIALPMTRSRDLNSFVTQETTHTSDLELSISHPLLRNAGRRATTAALRISSYNRQASEAVVTLEVIRQLAAVDRAYWRLYQARQELDVRQRQLELATAQQERAERRVRAGAAGEIELVRAQAGVAERLEAIILAQNSLLDRQRELKRIMARPGLSIDSTTAVVPASRPDPVEYLFDREKLIDAALSNRMEMLELELRLAADAVQTAFARNQTLPLLTLDYTYRINGLGASLGDSFTSLRENRFEDWELGLNAEVPLGNELQRSRLREAILRRLQRLASKGAREQAIRQEVLAAIDAIDAGWQRILASRQAAILSARALQAEQRAFEVGGSTSTNVLDAAARLADAQSAEIRALTDYQIAQVDLAFATGTLLGAERVSWEPVPAPSTRDPSLDGVEPR